VHDHPAQCGLHTPDLVEGQLAASEYRLYRAGGYRRLVGHWPGDAAPGAHRLAVIAALTARLSRQSALKPPITCRPLERRAALGESAFDKVVYGPVEFFGLPLGQAVWAAGTALEGSGSDELFSL